MTLPRQPNSPEEAYQIIADEVGVEVWASECGVSKDLVYKWTRGIANPSMEQMGDGQRLYVESGGDPILTNLLATLSVARPKKKRCAVSATLQLNAAAGEVSAAVEEALCPNSPGGETITLNEASEISLRAQRTHRAAHQVKEALA